MLIWVTGSNEPRISICLAASLESSSTGRRLFISPMEHHFLSPRNILCEGASRTRGLRLLTLTEFVVRRRLAEKQARLTGLYVGNPKRTTACPTAGRLLEAFQEITLTTIQESDRVRRHLTLLSDLQLRILDSLGFPSTIYTRLCADSGKPP